MPPRSRITSPPSLSRYDAATTAGTLAARAWLLARNLSATGLLRWHAEILLDVADQPARSEFEESVDTRFRIDLYSEEWGFLFCHAGQASWIRVTDVPFVHGRDDFRLLDHIPPLRELGALVRSVEHRHGLRLHRRHALVKTNLPASESSIRRWVEAL